ncbi:MAG: hypothetical protein H0V89_13035 [Deltaproteobacteria bacterium]|nr:hypothetical protein [Deltaproteobacteria bacterium]
MVKGDAAFASRVEQTVAAIEAGTDAEVVVVSAPRSGTYRDVPFAAASALVFLAMNAALFLPFTVSPWALSLELLLLWAAGAWLFSSAPVMRALTHPERRRRHVREAAFAEFHREAVHATPRRIGVLVYVSFLEQQVEIVCDVGIDAVLPGGRWIEVRRLFEVHTLDGFVTGLSAMGALLAEAVPASEHGPGLELSDAPRIRS